MRVILDGLAAISTRRPRSVVAGLLLATIAFAALASNNEFEVDLTEFGNDDSPTVQAMDRLRADFGDPTATVQVILDAGPGGDLLTRSGVAAVAAAERVALAAAGDALPRGDDGQPQVLSLRTALAGAMAQRGLDPTSAEDAQIRAAVAAAAAANPQLAALVSDDIEDGSARATVVLVRLDPTLTESERTDVGERVRAAFEGEPGEVPPEIDVTVYSSALFASGLLDAIRAEVPVLFGLALLVVLAILAIAYRSVFDVAVGFGGLVATVVWTFGLVAVLGPAFLGRTGPLSQLAVIVPVLLVGLGIDYSVHLTARYREQRAAGEAPTAAATGAVRTVGAALVLATAATAVGFASIATAPLGMLADFGIFVAVGVVCAFVIMSLLIPAARVWRDRRRDGAEGAVRQPGLVRLMTAPTRLAQRSPWAGITTGAVLVVASLVAATGLEIEFDRDDFIPERSEVAALLAHQRELFGGGVTESTFVLVDGDLTSPAVVEAVEAAQRGLAHVDGVRTVDGAPQAQQLTTPDASAAAVQIRTTVGDAGAERLQRDVEAAFAPVAAAGATVTVTSEPIIIAEMSQELSTFQLRAIGLTLAVVLVLLAAYYAAARRRPLLGVVAIIPAAISAALVLGTMWVLGVSFNVLTATLTAIAIGIGVPYGVHVVNRFVEDLEAAAGPDAIATTLRGTGGALAGSALTTLGAFVVLAFSGLPPIRSLGLLGGAGIAFALLGAVLVEPGALLLWGRHHGWGVPQDRLAAGHSDDAAGPAGQDASTVRAT